jgi:hypothetical protein
MRKSEWYAQEVISALTQQDVVAYVYHRATTGSVYIRFADSRIGSVRIADHNGRDHLRYKFNMRKDVKHFFTKKEKGILQYFVPMTKVGIQKLVMLIKERQTHVKDWQVKHRYNVPLYKQKEYEKEASQWK